MSDQSLRVALVTPFSWARPCAVNRHVADLSRELLSRGHQPVILTSSDEAGELRRMRALTRRPAEAVLGLLSSWERGSPAPERLLPGARAGGPLNAADGIPVIALGRSFAFRVNGSVSSIGLPVDVLSRLERVLVGGGFDVVHVHEPLAPSLSFTAIREARSPVVATFHLTPAGLVAYEIGAPVLSRFYRLLDERIVTCRPAPSVLAERLGGAYHLVPLGTRIGPASARPSGASPGGGPEAEPRVALYVYRGDDSRGLRTLMRTLSTAFPSTIDLLRVAVHAPSAELWPPRRAPRALRSRVEWVDFNDPVELAASFAEASVTILPFLGGEWLLQTAAEALASGSPIVAPDLPLVRGIAQNMSNVAYFDPGREGSLGTAMQSALEGPGPGVEDAGGEEDVADLLACDMGLHMREVAGSVVKIYRRSLERRAESGAREVGVPAVARPRRRLDRRASGPIVAPGGWIHADLHMHTSHSRDCTSSVEDVIATAHEVGLGAIAVTDHNAIEGARLARELAGDDLFVIVAEEVMTQQGEVIGLFLEELIPKGLTFDETLSLIKEQGGLVYVPHPFDRLRTTPSYQTMVANLHRIDVIETYNARNMLPQFNLTAERFAVKYNVAAGAGSDAHVLPGLGTAMLRMPRFDGPESFMTALREADIVTRRKSLFYLQSLKFLRSTLDYVTPGS
ncbi:MAG: glycosyltransferase [Actinobacteria bacterium]|nr:glycosyltransferase [Actinomycetota bacterium]